MQGASTGFKPSRVAVGEDGVAVLVDAVGIVAASVVGIHGHEVSGGKGSDGSGPPRVWLRVRESERLGFACGCGSG